MARSSQDRLNQDMGGVQVRVTGLNESLRALSRAGADAEDMRDLMHSTGEIVATSARRRAQVGATGNLRNSLRAGRGKTKAVVRAGSAVRVPYAGVQHYGWPARNIPGSMFLVQALHAESAAVTTHIEQGLRDLLRKNALV